MKKKTTIFGDTILKKEETIKEKILYKFAN